jgi:hypothetical protein
MVSFPRLSAAAARRLLVKPGVRRKIDAQRMMDAAAPHVTWAPTGASRASEKLLEQIGSDVRALARDCGFPKEGSTGSRATFDARASAWFAMTGIIPVGEALRDDVWTWLALALLPDVCAWRFEARASERFLGGRRNALQRLWMRGRAFDLGPDAAEERWSLLAALSEDSMVQITERPSIGADPRLACAIGDAWRRASARAPGISREDLMRTAVRNIRAAGEVICFAALGDDELVREVDRHFANAISASPFSTF